MEPDDYTYTTTSSTISVSSVSDYVDYVTDTVDLSSINISGSGIDWDTIIYNEKIRNDVRGDKIPVDIWAKMYNNGNIDD